MKERDGLRCGKLAHGELGHREHVHVCAEDMSLQMAWLPVTLDLDMSEISVPLHKNKSWRKRHDHMNQSGLLFLDIRTLSQALSLSHHGHSPSFCVSCDSQPKDMKQQRQHQSKLSSHYFQAFEQNENLLYNPWHLRFPNVMLFTTVKARQWHGRV